jgi:DNA replication and repair protein RecF
MLYLNKISLFQFKNYSHNHWQFTEPVIGICGPNGVGKTNLLDAIYFLCFTKGYFNRQDANNVQQGKQGMRIEGSFLNNTGLMEVVGILRENNKKEFLLNTETYKKFSEHIGRIPCVMIAPDDISIITGLSEERRRFIDTIISQYNQSYLEALIQYNKLLQQRNSWLKQIAEHKVYDKDLLEAINLQMVHYGKIIYKQRQLFMQEFTPMVIQYYTEIANNNDGLKLQYESHLHDNDFESLLKSSVDKDIILQRTQMGVHKDDLTFYMHDIAFKTRASQGQRKTLLLALKLAEFSILKKEKAVAPILLLDDIFEKLDEQRMEKLFYKVCVSEQCQVFITDTHYNRLNEYLSKMQINFQIINL